MKAAIVNPCASSRLREAESTTRHGRLLRIEPLPLGREVVAHFVYWTADAHGMNMIVKATDRACKWLVAQGRAAHCPVAIIERGFLPTVAGLLGALGLGAPGFVFSTTQTDRHYTDIVELIDQRGPLRHDALIRAQLLSRPRSVRRDLDMGDG